MPYQFDLLVRRGPESMRRATSPAEIRTAGVLSYNGAEMEFPTAPSIIESLSQCVQGGLLCYTLCNDRYRQAVRWWMETQRGFPIEEEWIVPTHGTIFSVATAIRMTTNPGEGIIVQPPVYNRFEQAATRLGRRTVYNRLLVENGHYRMDFAGLERLMADGGNKLFILCNPHNPIGKVWPAADLERIAALAAQYGVTVFSDEIFAEVVFGGQSCLSYATIPGAAPHAITATSLGKTFNFTGVNHANIIIPNEDLRQRFIQQRNADHYGSLDPLIHAAVLGAYSPEGARWKDAMVEYVGENIRLTRAFFAENLPEVHLSALEGGYVAWLDWRGLGMGDEELQDFLIKEAFLELDPGAHYGSPPGFARMSIAVPRQELRKSLHLLREAAVKRGFAKKCVS